MRQFLLGKKNVLLKMASLTRAFRVGGRMLARRATVFTPRARATLRVAAPRNTRRALAAGVRVSPASSYRYDHRNEPFMRLGFATLDAAEIDKAVRILAAARR